MVNDRMYFLNNMDTIKEDNYRVLEYEVTTDGEFRGEFDNEVYQLLIWEFSPKINGEEKKLCLRIKKGDSYGSWNSSSESGYYHGGMLEDELISIASLAFRKRLKLGPIVRIDDVPSYFPKIKTVTLGSSWIDYPLISGDSNLKDLSKFLELAKGLKVEYHQRFMWAVRLYHRAISIIEEEPDMAYLNLVSAIEALCQDTEIDRVELFEINKKLNDLIDKVDDIHLRNEIKASIMKREKFINRKFVKFILDHVEEDFWTKKTKIQGAMMIRPKELPSLLKKIYNQRSVTLHSGAPFPPYIFQAPMPPGSDILGALDITHLGRKWDKKEFIPYLHFFEGLVNYVIITFLKKNQKYGEYSVIQFLFK